jgi:hypothetical protein
MALTRMLKRMTPTRGERQPARQPPCTGRERVTLNNFWPEALPFLCLVALAGAIVYLASGF